MRKKILIVAPHPDDETLGCGGTVSRLVKDGYEASVLFLTDGESSRLNKTCVEKSQSAMYCGSFPYPSEDPGLSFVYSIANSGIDPHDLEEEINNELKLLQTTLVTEKEMQKIRNMIENDFVGNFTSMIGIAENLANYKMYFGDANLINTELNRYLKVTREDIKRVANDYFKPSNRVILYYLPKENG